MVHYYTGDDRPVLSDEVHQDEGKVERDGYMTTEQIVEAMIDAGEMLQQYREYMYPSADQVGNDDFPDVMMNKMDAELESRALRRRLSAAEIAAKEKEAADLAAAAELEAKEKPKEEAK